MFHGWTPQTCLKMPARQFYAVLREGRKIESERQFQNFLELTRIAKIPQYVPQYADDLFAHYEKIAYPNKKETGVLRAEDPKTAAILRNMLRGLG